MASYPSSIVALANPAGGTSLLTEGVGHAALTGSQNDEIEAIETTLGTNSGTAILKNFVAGQFAARTSGETFGTSTWIGGTISSPVINGTPTIGTPSITGGTANTITLGTPTLQGTVVNTENIADGAVTSRKTGLTTGYGTVSSGTTASTSFVDLPGGSAVLVLAATSNVFLFFTGSGIEGGANNEGTIALVRDSTIVHSISNRYSTAAIDANIAINAMDISVAAGTYTYKAQHCTNAGTLTTKGKFGAIVFS